MEDRGWETTSIELLGAAVPWRTVRWHKGQRHYSGTYWSATVDDHVIYESRLELGRLLFADFDRSVRHIVAQPFLLKAVLEGKVRKHIPDYLLLTEQGPVVVDVKPLHRVSKPEVAFAFGWTRQLVESRGVAVRGLDRAATGGAGEHPIPGRIPQGLAVRPGAHG
ncbi:TnsA-like heteromeric transposase endonuclease subunit [Streptomyces sp. NPDC051644]|uniref:TnsA-like heteromeric transposase endonuclease subunit n=1 Tax=Streptomyces sp. NPDC051644 TaxID=3365666 RepID=UPI00379245AB